MNLNVDDLKEVVFYVAWIDASRAKTEIFDCHKFGIHKSFEIKKNR